MKCKLKKIVVKLSKKKKYLNYFIYLRKVEGGKEINVFNDSIPIYKESHEF